MEGRKQLYKGIAIGVVITVFVCSSFFWAVAAKHNLGNKNTQMNQKINEIIGVLDKKYVDGVDEDELREGVYAGLVEAVDDRYTSYMSREVFHGFVESMAGQYAGIGFYVYANQEDNTITVSSTIKGSPGAALGVLPDDKIIKINDIDVNGEMLDEAVQMMKGKPGTEVNITVYRPAADETKEYTVKRETIDIPSVAHEMLENQIGYIQISSFDENTAEQFGKAYDELNGQGQQAMIIDVRNNLGGYLPQVVQICDMVLPEATIVYREDKQGTKRYEKSTAAESFDKPMVVLVNGASASASEILAGALKDNDAAVLVGTTTYGKGLVQEIAPLSDGSALKVTIERYYTPSGVCINGIGIDPDYEVELPEGYIPGEGQDTQLEKAVELLKEKISGAQPQQTAMTFSPEEWAAAE